MIGVIADSADRGIVSEFFELFKTPWEFYCSGKRYEVILCSGDGQFDEAAKLSVVYAGRKMQSDDEQEIRTGCQRMQPCILSYQGNRLPLYGESITFPEDAGGVLTDEDSRQSVAHLHRSGQSVQARIGYDLFSEVRDLLTVGQPTANGNLPALELHIAFLRNLITGCGISLTEIPPVPQGYRFIACLTHDVDHPSIRPHKWDHTTLGFLYRAVFGSLRDLMRGRMSVGDLVKNWTAALKLPFVQLGLAKDFWREFDRDYLELEKGLHSTFFVIPFKNRPGSKSDGPAPAFRGAQYGARDVADKIERLLGADCEIGLHGIDAWLNSSRGRDELEEIRRLTGSSEIGVRMHWLYYDQQSPVALERAGAAYDSTVGYNDTIGYRAGTTQVYKPLEAARLLELPLHAMDTALFYPTHLGLSPWEARTRLSQMVENAVQFGGCFTVNWHDRSIAPERLWGGCYRDLIQELKDQGAWFATAGQAVSWFRKRRSVTFQTDSGSEDACLQALAGDADNMPGLQLRIHTGAVCVDKALEARVPCGA